MNNLEEVHHVKPMRTAEMEWEVFVFQQHTPVNVTKGGHVPPATR